MPHSEEFNRRRRELYRQARLQGLPPREAGHFYNRQEFPRQVAERLRERPDVRVQERESPLERQQRSGLDTSRYRFHNYYPTYVRVRIDYTTEDGRRHRAFTTVAFDRLEIPSRQAIVDRVHRDIERNFDAYEGEVVGVSILGIEQVPDRTEAP